MACHVMDRLTIMSGIALGELTILMWMLLALSGSGSWVLSYSMSTQSGRYLAGDRDALVNYEQTAWMPDPT